MFSRLHWLLVTTLNGEDFTKLLVKTIPTLKNMVNLLWKVYKMSAMEK